MNGQLAIFANATAVITTMISWLSSAQVILSVFASIGTILITIIGIWWYFRDIKLREEEIRHHHDEDFN
jgi:ABC-type nickel/cobalt efflux system permease component RcnA